MKLLRHYLLNAFFISFAFFIFTVFVMVNTACSKSTSEEKKPGCMYVENGFGPEGRVKVRVETVVSGLEVPWGIAFLPNGNMLVTERAGRIRLVKNYNGNALLSEVPVATLTTAGSSEGGLLGIALHPEFETNRLFYIYVTVTSGRRSMNQVEQWRLSVDGNSAERVKIIFDNIEASSNHNGGRIAFGPDNMLYVGTGDASDPSSGQNPESPNGKLLRLTPEGDVPADNPREGNPLFLMGIRNTQGWAWPDENDATKLWITDHGPSGERLRYGHDELNIASASDNLGWPDIYKCETKEGFVSPSLVWQKAAPPGGAAIYTGSAIPEWKGSILIGTLGSRHLQRVVIENNVVISHEVYFKDSFGRIREVIMSPEGDLFITTSNCDGRGSCPESGDIILKITK